MSSRKSSSGTAGKTDDDVFIEEFAKEFFGTDQPYNEFLQPERKKVNRKEYKKEREKYEDAYSPRVHTESMKKSERKIKTPRNETQNENGHSHPTIDPGDSRQPLVKRFVELKCEFLSLSDRLHDASMPKVSKQLTQLLTERQNLVKLLLDMDASAPFDFDPENDEKRLHDQSKPRYGASKQEFRMPRKAKSVHWSDEHLGGSIIQDPSAYVYQTSNSNGVQTPGRNNEDISKPPPIYKMVDTRPRTSSSGERQRDSRLDLKLQCCCNTRIHDEMEYVKEILNEAAELRREACCMIWRAHYLEQLCDVDGLVKHVYRSTSNLPSLPRYSHLYR